MQLLFDPFPFLLTSHHPAIHFFYERDLLGMHLPDKTSIMADG